HRLFRRPGFYRTAARRKSPPAVRSAANPDRSLVEMSAMKKLLLLVSATLLCVSVVAEDACDKLGWQLAVHAYTFRKFTIFECIEKTASLGLKYMSLSGSVSLDGKNSVKTVELADKDMQSICDKAKTSGLKLVNIGVVQLPANEA